ncbi:MAG: hypothetical protein K6C97_02180 [Treponema sp.]|nr:hypothetical protein [Treponema sp.]
MKKITAAAFVITLLMSALSAYNPPVGSEDMCLLSSPRALTGSLSVTGGAIFSAGAESIVVNPALTASEQRINLNFAYTMLLSGNDQDESRFGSAFQGAIMIPFKLYVFTGYVNGTFANFTHEMYLGNSINAKVGLSKEITDKLNVGASLSGGYTWKFGSDWAIGANLGFVYNAGDLGFLKSFRYGASILNLGKNYADVVRLNLDSSQAISPYPSLATLKVGAAGSFVKNDNIEIGAAFDVTVPTFQNAIFDLNLQAGINNMLFISVGEKFNLRETIAGYNSFIPSIGLIFKFNFNMKNNDYFAANDWSQSEMIAGLAYKNLYSNIHAISAGLDVNLGMEDTTPPQIILIDMDDEE